MRTYGTSQKYPQRLLLFNNQCLVGNRNFLVCVCVCVCVSRRPARSRANLRKSINYSKFGKSFSGFFPVCVYSPDVSRRICLNRNY
jgi:hypothetical protein